MIKNFIQFNENLTFDKGYERIDKDSPDFERYWSHSKKMNNADYNSIVKLMREVPSNHVGSFVDVWNSIEETFNACQFLSEVTLGVLTIV